MKFILEAKAPIYKNDKRHAVAVNQQYKSSKVNNHLVTNTTVPNEISEGNNVPMSHVSDKKGLSELDQNVHVSRATENVSLQTVSKERKIKNLPKANSYIWRQMDVELERKLDELFSSSELLKLDTEKMVNRFDRCLHAFFEEHMQVEEKKDDVVKNPSNRERRPKWKNAKLDKLRKKKNRLKKLWSRIVAKDYKIPKKGKQFTVRGDV